MTPNRDGKAVVPGRDGYDVEFVEVTGPPDSMMPMPPAKSRGKLTPLGTGEGVPAGVPHRAGPGQLRRKGDQRIPLVPKWDEVSLLPQRALVAFAARCARRGVPAFGHFLPQSDPAIRLQTVTAAVSIAEEAAYVAVYAAEAAAYAGRAVYSPYAARTDADASDALALAAYAAAEAASAARSPYANRTAAARAAARAADAAATLLFRTATIDTPLTAQLRCIRRDFIRLKKLARKEKWTDDTPVPPQVFGPMWPEGVEPYWAVEPPSPAPE